ncbi:hypothetical protein L195_g050518, partial [Trifolium pratense]
MRRQIAHMIKYRYIPFSLGKQVFTFNAYIAFDHLPCKISTVAKNLMEVAAVALVQTEVLLCHDLKNTDLKV